MTFDPHTELATLRQQTALIRKPRYARSRLDRHRAELLAAPGEPRPNVGAPRVHHDKEGALRLRRARRRGPELAGWSSARSSQTYSGSGA